MYYADLSIYTYDKKFAHSEKKQILCVGWLEIDYPYTQGNVQKTFLDSLWLFCHNPVRAKLGFHECAFCNKSSPGTLARHDEQDLILGSAEIWVLGANNVVYAAPDLIYHYITEHNYRPPDEFIQAVLECPLPESEEYKSFMKGVGLK